MKESKEAERIIEMYEFTNYHGQSPEYAKQCALIHVNGFLEFHEHLFITEGSIAYQYWQKVKSIIESK